MRRLIRYLLVGCLVLAIVGVLQVGDWHFKKRGLLQVPFNSVHELLLGQPSLQIRKPNLRSAHLVMTMITRTEAAMVRMTLVHETTRL